MTQRDGTTASSGRWERSPTGEPVRWNRGTDDPSVRLYTFDADLIRRETTAETGHRSEHRRAAGVTPGSS
jgi:hypothetical protein